MVAPAGPWWTQSVPPALVDAVPFDGVVREDESTGTIFVITVYQPDPNLWDAAFRERKQP